MMTVDELLETEYWIIDILPKQVPENSDGQFFDVERYYLKRMDVIKGKHIDLILKLNCYRDISIDGEVNPDPERIGELLRSRYQYILTGDSMILSEPDDTHMTLFNPDGELLDLVRGLARGEGLYVWQPEEKR